MNRELLEADHGDRRDRGARDRQLLARSRASSRSGAWSSCAPASPRRWRRAPRRPSSAWASPPCTARASRPCSSTRRSRCSPRGSGSGWRSAPSPVPWRSRGVGYAILGMGKRLPLKPMLITGASILLLLSVAFAGNADPLPAGADALGATPVHAGWARLPVFVAELTGIHPTREGLVTQAAMLVVFLLGAAVRLRVAACCASAVSRPRGDVGMSAIAAAPAVRVGVDVGGTFTKAVAVDACARTRSSPRPSCRHPTSRRAASPRGSPRFSAPCSISSAPTARRVEFVAFSTTTAMNALLEGDVARVGVVGIGAAARPSPRPQAHRRRRRQARSRPHAAHRARVPRRQLGLSVRACRRCRARRAAGRRLPGDRGERGVRGRRRPRTSAWCAIERASAASRRARATS